MLKGRESRLKLEDELNKVLEKLNYDRSIAGKVINYFVQKNYSRGRISGLLGKSIPIQMADDIELCLLSIQAYEHLDTDRDLINPTKYFNQSEIEAAQKYSKLEESNESNILVFNNVIQVNPQQYICSLITMQEIGDMNKRGLITYNPSTQREKEKRVFDGRIVEGINIRYDKLKEIMKTIENHKPITNVLSLNILSNGEEQFEYNEKTKQLKVAIGDKTEVNIIDGAHRFVGICRLLEEKPNHDYNFVFNIFNYTEDVARDYIVTQDKQTPLNQLHVKAMSNEDPYMVMARELNRTGSESTNELYGRITADTTDIEHGKAYTTFEVISKAIQINFDEKEQLKPIDRVKIQKFLIDAFVYVIGNFHEEFNNKSKSKLDSIITEPNMFIGYVAILSNLYNKSDWETQLVDILDNIDFNRSNSDWNDIGMFNNKLTKPTLRKISNYFKEFVK